VGALLFLSQKQKAFFCVIKINKAQKNICINKKFFNKGASIDICRYVIMLFINVEDLKSLFICAAQKSLWSSSTNNRAPQKGARGAINQVFYEDRSPRSIKN